MTGQQNSATTAHRHDDESSVWTLAKKGNIMTGAQALSVVLVHGGWVDGSGWEGVYRILRKDGYHVSIVQHPTSSLADDVAATRLILAAQDQPVLLVGHSYGGAVFPRSATEPKTEEQLYN